MFDQFQLIQLFKVETAVNPTTRLKSTTTRKRVATRRLRNAALEKRFSTKILLEPFFFLMKKISMTKNLEF